MKNVHGLFSHLLHPVQTCIVLTDLRIRRSPYTLSGCQRKQFHNVKNIYHEVYGVPYGAKNSVLYGEPDKVRLRPSSAAKTFVGYLCNSVQEFFTKRHIASVSFVKSC